MLTSYTMYFKPLRILVFLIVVVVLSIASQKEDIKNKIIDSKLRTSRSNPPHNKGHILVFHNAGTRSHLIAMNALVEGLLEQGHRVTSVIYAESKIVNDNYKEILIEDK